MLDILHLSFDYQEHRLFKNLCFHLPAGGLLHLRGANGTGKTTLLKLIAGLYTPHEGQIVYRGQNIKDNTAAYQRQLCFIGHKAGINPYLSLRENCLFDLHFRAPKVSVSALAALFKLEAYLDTPCGLLSAGQRRQVALLRLWFSDAALWLLDEPFTALDERSLALLMAQIDAHRKGGGAVLLTSHQALSLDSSVYQEFFL